MDLLKKLGNAKFDTSLLRSSKNIARPKPSRRAISNDIGGASLADVSLSGDAEGISDEDLSSSDISSTDILKSAPLEPSRPASPRRRASEVQQKAASEASVVGSGLKRPLELDNQGNPVIKKRQRSNPKLSIQEDSDELPWDGFGSGTESFESMEDDEAASSSLGSELDSDDESEDSLGSKREGRMPVFAFASQNESKTPVRIVPRVSSDFKTWAAQQINAAQDFTPSGPVINSLQQPKEEHALATHSVLSRSTEQEVLPPELEVDPNAASRKAFSVEVHRTTAIQESRLKLPIVAEEQKIMEAIHNNPVTIVCGATGSGKTTQIPQFLYEAGYGSPDGPTPGMIGVTQPRRVAAVTMAQRVGEELCNPGISSYQIRFDSTVGKQTAIKFMTDGILIREISQDFALSKYSAIVIDEAHERSVNTDILIGMASRIVDLRATLSRKNSEIKPLKLIIMSATLMKDSFLNNSNLFPKGTPPLVESEGRQHTVTIHFARRTQRDYVDEALRKIIRGHRKLPPGGMLVFLTGQNEISDLARKLGEKLSTTLPPGLGKPTAINISAKDAPLETDDLELGDQLIDREGLESDQESEMSEDDTEFDIEGTEEASSKALILPLFSQLPTKEQLRVFQPPPPNTRLIILATNVAETSITIPGIRYVIDCGRSKEKSYDRSTGVQSFEIGWISKASAAQRAGRAGRTGPGHCYRLYSSAVYERDFAEHTDPEILRMPVEGVVLQLKSMELQHTANFPFPTPPDGQAIVKGEKLLRYLGALDKNGKVTSLGRDLSIYPLSPRFAKMLAIGHQHDCIYYAAALVASLATPEIFIPEAQLNLGSVAKEGEVYSNADRLEDSTREQRKRDYNKAHYSFSTLDKYSDALKLLSAFCAYNWALQAEDVERFCASMFLRAKAMKEASQLYQQLLYIISTNHLGSINHHKSALKPPSKTQIAALKQMVAAGFLDQVAIRADLAPQPPELPKSPRRSIDVPYLTLFPIHEGKADSVEAAAVFIHPSSVLAHTSPNDLPHYLIYSTLQRSAPSVIAGAKTPKTRMHPLTAVTGAQLSALARGTPLLEYGKPVGKVQEVENERDRRIAWVVPSLVGGSGGRAWPLPAVKALQKRDGRGEWVVERIER